ncbi:SDR family NAD(P)-dependent oxidoreductase [Actinophytocola sediminis]
MAQVVVVSGGGTGIGRAVATAFARDGSEVVLVGRRAEVLSAAEKEIRSAEPPGSVWSVPADLTDPADATRVRDTILDRYQSVDVLVNNAGGNAVMGAPAAPDLATTAEHWLANFQTNVLTAVLLTEALRDVMTSPGGRVILLSSIAAYRGSGSGSYGAAKAALHPYAYDLAAALGQRGITVNVVAPGYVTDTEFFGTGVSAERHQVLISQTSTGRAGAPVDVANTVRWLASPAAGHVTAQVIQVNGGAERGR